jgi:predicted transposase/invertase (TIGR01784 family)
MGNGSAHTCPQKRRTCMQRRKLEDLNLLDDFLFTSMVTYPEIGEEFSRELLQIIFQRKFGRLKVIPQRFYPGVNTDRHGARLDVVLEDEDVRKAEGASIIDVEPDRNDGEKAIRSLPKRVRFYHAKIDAGSLKSGEQYGALKNVIIILITPYDPFKRDRMVYTIQNRCVEEPEMPYDDGAKTIFLYSRGTKGNPPEELRQLLEFMEHTEDSYARTPKLRNILNMVDTVKRDSEVSVEYMKIFEREAMLVDIGRDEGMLEGEEYKLVKLVCRKLLKGKSIPEIAEDLEEDEEVIRDICQDAEEFAPEYDADKIMEKRKRNR